MKASDKLIDALSQLILAFSELQDEIEEDYGSIDTEDPVDAVDLAGEEEVDTVLITEMRNAIETVIDNEECSLEEIAAIVSSLTEGVEEIDPDIFVQEEDEIIDQDVSDDYEDGDYLYDDEEFDDLDDEDEEEEEEVDDDDDDDDFDDEEDED